MAALVTGPIAYFIFKRRYGGLTQIDPVNYPVNSSTGLGIGDTKRMAWMFAAMTLVGGIASFFLPWFDDDPAYYTETYGIEGLFGLLISCIRWMTALSGVLTVTLMIIASRVEPEDASAAVSA
jgi:hypothetical protein